MDQQPVKSQVDQHRHGGRLPVEGAQNKRYWLFHGIVGMAWGLATGREGQSSLGIRRGLVPGLPQLLPIRF